MGVPGGGVLSGCLPRRALTQRGGRGRPESGENNVIYLVPSAASAVNNAKDEYMWLDGKWELFGSTAVDLSGYWSRDTLRAMSADELKAILV